MIVLFIHVKCLLRRSKHNNPNNLKFSSNTRLRRRRACVRIPSLVPNKFTYNILNHLNENCYFIVDSRYCWTWYKSHKTIINNCFEPRCLRVFIVFVSYFCHSFIAIKFSGDWLLCAMYCRCRYIKCDCAYMYKCICYFFFYSQQTSNSVDIGCLRHIEFIRLVHLLTKFKYIHFIY